MATPPDFVSGAVLTAQQMSQIASWKIAAASFTTSSALNINDCFTSDYRNYRITIHQSASSTTCSLGLRMRVSGVDAATSYYSSGIGGNLAGTAATIFDGNNNTTSATIGKSISTGFRSIVIDMMNPATTDKTIWHGFYLDHANLVHYTFGGNHDVATAYDGFSVIPSAGNFTGLYKIYGYRD